MRYCPLQTKAQKDGVASCPLCGEPALSILDYDVSRKRFDIGFSTSVRMMCGNGCEIRVKNPQHIFQPLFDAWSVPTLTERARMARTRKP